MRFSPTSDYSEMINEIVRIKAKDLYSAQSSPFQLSQLDLVNLLKRIPDDFKMSYPSEFAYVVNLGMRGTSKPERLDAILHSAPMLWLRDHHPVQCAKTIGQLLGKMPPALLPKATEYLLSGEFAPTLATKHPQAFADLFFKAVSLMEPKASAAFAKVSMADPALGLYSVIPDNRLNLPPMALLQQQSGTLEIKAIHPDFLKLLPAKAKSVLHDVFDAEAKAATLKGQPLLADRLVKSLDAFNLG